MTSTLCIQNPAKPSQIKKIKFKSQEEACQAGSSLHDALSEGGMGNREMPLIFVSNEDDTKLAHCGRGWWEPKVFEDGRIVSGDKEVKVIFETKPEIGESIQEKLPMWVFSWAGFLR